MSKYIKLEDAISVCQLKQIIRNGDTIGVRYPMPEEIMNDLSDLPTIEVSEDCISREYLLSKVYDMDNDNLVVDLKDIDNAPSVIPKPKEEETPTCSECDHYEDHHTSLACANCPVITKVWGGKDNE